jgi:serine/threonine protein kinase
VNDPDRTTAAGEPAPGTATFDPNRTTGLAPAPPEWDAPARALATAGYELLDELGRGGMGVVFRARDTRLNRTVALKMVLGRAGGAEAARFRAEAMAAVAHPNVAKVFGAGDTGGVSYLAMELLPGGTLAARFGPNRLTPAAAAELVRKVADGVAAAHAQGIVHRDLKPANVLFDAAGEPKVTDFGLAKRAAGSDLTATGAIMGTPAYMAPEQAGGGAKFVGPPADVWALGAILYEALTGTRPFDGPDVRAVLARVLTADPVAPRKLAPAVPRDLERICLTCLAKKPHERYPTAAELAADLARFARGEPISVRPVGALGRASPPAGPTVPPHCGTTRAARYWCAAGTSGALLRSRSRRTARGSRAATAPGTSSCGTPRPNTSAPTAPGTRRSR